MRERAEPQEEPDSRLTSHYLRTDRRTVVTRFLVPFPLETSSVCVVNSVPRYFMGFRALMSLASGAGPLGPTASLLMSFLLFFACTLSTGAFVSKVTMLIDARIAQMSDFSLVQMSELFALSRWRLAGSELL